MGGAVLEWGNFCLSVGLSLEVSQVRSQDIMAADLQMGTLLFYHSPILSLIMMTVGARIRNWGKASVS
jgi:hypothetical protein